MQDEQNTQNPDVNSFDPDSGASEGIEQNSRNESADIERTGHDEVIPVPPDSEPQYPIEEPPAADDSPVGDVDDSPKQIVGT